MTTLVLRRMPAITKQQHDEIAYTFNKSGGFYIDIFEVEELTYKAERRNLKEQRTILSFQESKNRSISYHHCMHFLKNAWIREF